MSTPSTGSVSSVDPGKIKQFAQFLDDIATDFSKHVVEKLAHDPDDKEPFGNYNESSRAAERHAKLLDQQHMPVLDREDHRRANAPRAADILPPPALLRGDELALPDDLFGLVSIHHTHIPISARAEPVEAPQYHARIAQHPSTSSG